MRTKAFFVGCALACLIVSAVPASADPHAFVDQSSRIPFTPDDATLSTDVEFIDMDRDGDLDFLVARGGLDGVQDAQPLAFVNNGSGTFTRGRFAPRGFGDFTDIEFGDANGDGFLDAVVSVNLGPEQLWLWNSVRSRFLQRARAMPPNQPADVTIESRFFDADGDGDLDIITAAEDPFTAPGAQNRLYLNTGGARYIDVTATNMPAILDDSSAIGLGDFDRDGDTDAIAINAGQDIYLQNDGTGHFADQTSARLPIEPANADSGRDVVEADFDSDGDLDLFIAVSRQDRSPAFWLNDGAGHFTDVTLARLPVLAMSAQDVEGCDIDRDGDLDLVLSDSGAVLNPPQDHRFVGAPNHIYVNNGSAVFTDVSAALLPQDAEATFSIACGDVDGDGDADLIAANGRNQPMRAYIQA